MPAVLLKGKRRVGCKRVFKLKATLTAVSINIKPENGAKGFTLDMEKII
jgi:hypothetical protein